MSAMAFIVSPVKPNVGFISTVLLSAMLFSLVCVYVSVFTCVSHLFLSLRSEESYEASQQRGLPHRGSRAEAAVEALPNDPAKVRAALNPDVPAVPQRIHPSWS